MANQYRLQVWQQRMEEFSESENVKSLRDEIGILRLTLEALLDRCQDKNDLLLHSHKIGDLAMKINKLVVDCNRLEKNMGMLMDKATALSFAGKVVDCISQYVTDPEIIDKISSGIVDALNEVTV